MMKVPVYSVRDIKVGFMNPMVDMNDNAAKRNFAFAINNPSNGVMNFVPKDFDLYFLGLFDQESGEFESVGLPELVVSGDSVYGVD